MSLKTGDFGAIPTPCEQNNITRNTTAAPEVDGGQGNTRHQQGLKGVVAGVFGDHRCPADGPHGS